MKKPFDLTVLLDLVDLLEDPLDPDLSTAVSCLSSSNGLGG